MLASGIGRSQTERLWHDVGYGGSITATMGSGDNAPFWLTNNRQGLGNVDQGSIMVRAYVERDAKADSLRHWKVGYGLDLAAGCGLQSHFTLQQAYIDAGWKMLRLSVGQKERWSELKHRELTTGGLTLGHNARPLPQVRVEVPDFWTVPTPRGLFALKGHVAYGWYTDNVWQRHHNAGTDNIYTSGSWHHSKSLFIRIGNEKRFPLVLTAGLEMACQFGGEGYNLRSYTGGTTYPKVDIGGSMLDAFIPGLGGDVNDDQFTNAVGNHIGSYHLRLDWKARTWSIGAYWEHMYEDESGMFLQYGLWKDMLLGLEVNLPRNPFVSTIVYEHNGTMDQQGPIYHDATPENPLQISTMDAYYDNHVYGSWQHGGFVMGNPTILSPLYNGYLGYQGSLQMNHNRTSMHHVGLKGNPTADLSWRFLFTHEKNLGSYHRPVKDPLYGRFYLLEATYHLPRKVRGLSLTAAYARNGGTLLGRSNGGMLSMAYRY